jgi:hypothetical protein
MKKSFGFLIAGLAILFTLNISGQVVVKNCNPISTTIKGTYKGKNLFFQNDGANGIQKILLNKEEVVSNYSSAAFEILLSSLKTGEAFELNIVYCDKIPAPYKLLNPEAIK